MPLLFTYLVVLSIGIFAIVVVVEGVASRRFTRLAISLFAIVLTVVVLRLTTGFPKSTRLVMFGGTSPLLGILIMFACTLLGMVAHYIFYMRKRSFSWLSLSKPLVVSPIILLPLIGSMQANAALEPIQLISIGILAFQNGFFWKSVFSTAAGEQ